MGDGIGDLFQKETKYFRGKIGGGQPRWKRMPKACKVYREAPKVKLETTLPEGGMPLWEAVGRRRSVRDFQAKPIQKADLARLLWASQGITEQFRDGELRAAPSAGALYPVETYLVIQKVEGIEPGIYHYNVRQHELELLRKGDFSGQTAEAALEQEFLAEGAVVFIWTAVFARSGWKYRERAYRYIYLDAGHIAQNTALAAVALGLGSCQVAALYDDEVNALVGVDGEEESVVYMTVVGRPR